MTIRKKSELSNPSTLSSPTYQNLFGSDAYYTVEPARSILSPAAYFVELMKLVENNIQGSKLLERRPDLLSIKLDSENTFDPLPKIEIVNTVLESKIADGVNLLTAQYPFNLPYNQALDQIRHYLIQNDKSLQAIWASLIPTDKRTADEDKTIQLGTLGLSYEQWNLYITSLPTEPEEATKKIREAYGLAATVEPITHLASVENFLQASGLNMDQLRTLLYQDLSDAEIAAGQNTHFYINTGTGKSAISIKGQQLENLSLIGLDHIQRFVRLAQAINWSFADLDWALRTIGNITNSGTPVIDDKDLPYLAWMQGLVTNHDFSIDQCCACIGTLKNFGEKDGPSFYQQVFDNHLNPQPQGGWAANPTWNVPSPGSASQDEKDKSVQNALAAALQISHDDLLTVANLLLKYQKDGNNPLQLNAQNLAILYRLSLLPKLTELSIKACLVAAEFISAPPEEGIVKSLLAKGLALQGYWLSVSAPASQTSYLVNGPITHITSNTDGEPGTTTYEMTVGESKTLTIDITESACTGFLINGQQPEGITPEDVDKYCITSSSVKINLFGVAGNDVALAMDTLCDFATWLSATPLSVYELQFILRGKSDDPNIQNKVLEKDTASNFLQGLLRNIKNALLTEALFYTGINASLHKNIDPYIKKEALPNLPNILRDIANKIYTKLKEQKYFDDKGVISFSQLDKTEEITDIVVNVLNAESGQSLEPIPADKVKPIAAVISTVIVTLFQQHYHSQHNALLTQLATLLNLSVPVAEAVKKWGDKNANQLHEQGDQDLLSYLISSDSMDAPKLAVLQKLQQSAELVQILALSATETTYFKVDYHPTATYPISLNAVRTIWQFKQLVTDFQDTQNNLLNLIQASFTDATGTVPAKQISSLTGWDASQLVELLGNHCLVIASSDPYHISVADVALLQDYFSSASQLNIDISNLWSLRQLSVPERTQAQEIAVANSLWGGLQTQYAAQPDVLANIKTTLGQKLRDRLVTLAIHSLADKLNTPTARGLYEYLLIDVEVSGVVQTSKVKNAISTVQLYIYRCLNNLEHDVTVDSGLTQLWIWMHSYREWQANKEVFLYPEDYIQPELRKNKTDLFAKVENDLKQVDLTNPDSVENIFREYMNGFAEIAALDFDGVFLRGYYKNGDANDKYMNQLAMVGRSQAQAHGYYFRIATLYLPEGSGNAVYVPMDWGQWRKLNIQIHPVEYEVDEKKYTGIVTPWFAFGRWYLFWIENKQSGQDDNKKPTYTISICYSYLDFNGRWVATQTLASFPRPVIPTVDLPLPFNGESSRVTLSYDGNRLKVEWKSGMEQWKDNTSYLTSTISVNENEYQSEAIAPEKGVINLGGIKVRAEILGAAKLTALLHQPDGVDALLANSTQLEIYSGDNAAFTMQSAASTYYWELFFHLPFLIAHELQTHQQFPAAKKWYQYVFSPNALKLEMPTSIVSLCDGVLPQGATFKPDDDPHYVRGPLGSETALSFNGSDNYILLPNNGFNNIRVNSTIMTWVYVEELIREQIIFAKVSNGSIDAKLSISGNGNVSFETSTNAHIESITVLKAKKWYHLKVSYTEFNARIYIDWQLDYMKTGHFIVGGGNDDTHIAIGAVVDNPASDPAYFNGCIADFFIFDQSEIPINTIQALLHIRFWRFFGLLRSYNPVLEAELSETDLQGLWDDLNDPTQIEESEEDPFDPQAIAMLRPIAYQKTIVMHYIDNLLAWGDKLFRENTRESIVEAEMFYVAAYDLLGEKPQDLGPELALPPVDYEQIKAGYVWKKNAKPSDAITCLYATADTLYAGTYGQGLWARDARKQEWTPVANGFPTTAHVNCMCETDGILYVGTDQGLWVKQQSWKPDENNFPAGARVTCLYYGQRNMFYAGVEGQGLWVKYSQGWAREQDLPYEISIITCIYGLGPMLYIGTDRRGIWVKNIIGRDDDKRWKQQVHTPYRDIPVYFLYQTGSTFYAGTARGIWVNERDAWAPTNGFPAANCLYEANGKLYAGSDTGLWMQEQGWGHVKGFPGSIDVSCLCEKDGTLYVGTNAGLWTNDAPYFGIPRNQQFLAYWDEVQGRLYNIRHGLNIDGQLDLLPLFQPPINPMQLVSAVASGEGLAQIINASNATIPYYRFSVVAEKAKAVTQTVTQLGQSLLSILERKDDEQLAMLYNTHQQNILNLTQASKQDQLKAAEKTVDALKTSHKNAEARLSHYKKWIKDDLSSGEHAQIDMAFAAIATQIVAEPIKGAAIAGYLSPSIFGFSDGGMKWGDAVNQGASIAETAGNILNQGSGVAGVMASFKRRTQDWELQKILAEDDKKQIHHQVVAAQHQHDLARQEIKLLDKNIEQAKSIAEFYLKRFTSTQLYQWYIGQVSALYFQAYQLAHDLAMQAENAWHFEHTGLHSQGGDNASSLGDFIKPGYWNSLRQGLLAGESLMLDLQRMEKAFLDQNVRRLEIEKTISLAQLDPKALLDLITTGKCTFDISEKDFAFDFPGHYCRQIKTLSVSVPVVLGPYQNLHATLTQLSNKIITSDDNAGEDAVKYLLGKSESSSSALKVDIRPNEQVALSQGVNDSGLFQLNFNDERYLPFEGTGAVSSWVLEMPHEDNPFDFAHLTDVIMQLRYTALAGSNTYKDVVTTNRGDYQGVSVIPLAQAFPEAWRSFNKTSDSKPLDIVIAPTQFRSNFKTYDVIGLSLLVITTAEDEANLDIELKTGGSEPKTIKFSGNAKNDAIIDGEGPGGTTLNISLPKTLSSVKWTLSLQEGKTLPADISNLVLWIDYSASPKS